MNRLTVILIFGGFLGGCSGFMQKSIVRMEVQTPRPFGYFIGDELCQRVVVETRSDTNVDTSSIPSQGEINHWLNLNRVRIDFDRKKNLTKIGLCYQVFYAANEVKMLTIPGFSMRFTRYGTTISETVPNWRFTLSPIRELAVRKDESNRAYTRPDTIPPLLADHDERLKLYASLAVVLLNGCYLTYAYGLLPIWPKRRIFKYVSAQLVNIPDREIMRALAVLHYAFNTLYGKPLFRHKLDEFYLEHPEYRITAEQLDWFFDFSEQMFFAGRSRYGREEWKRLRQLCRQCRDIERGAL